MNTLIYLYTHLYAIYIRCGTPGRPYVYIYIYIYIYIYTYVFPPARQGGRPPRASPPARRASRYSREQKGGRCKKGRLRNSEDPRSKATHSHSEILWRPFATYPFSWMYKPTRSDSYPNSIRLSSTQ